MTQTLKLASLLLGALALSLTLATAEGKCGQDKCGDAPKTTKTAPKKCQTGKCASGKCGNATKETDTKPAPAKGKCGQGKCG